MTDPMRNVAAVLARLADGFGDGTRRDHQTLTRMQNCLDELRELHDRTAGRLVGVDKARGEAPRLPPPEDTP